MRTLLRIFLFGAALAAPPVLAGGVFVGVLASSDAPWDARVPGAYDPRRCTWYCHDRDCRHAPVLTAVLAGNDGAYQWTIDALDNLGEVTGVGYQGANLIVFCVLWPLVTGLAYAVAVARAIWNLT